MLLLCNTINLIGIERWVVRLGMQVSPANCLCAYLFLLSVTVHYSCFEVDSSNRAFLLLRLVRAEINIRINALQIILESISRKYDDCLIAEPLCDLWLSAGCSLERKSGYGELVRESALQIIFIINLSFYFLPGTNSPTASRGQPFPVFCGCLQIVQIFWRCSADAQTSSPTGYILFLSVLSYIFYMLYYIKILPDKFIPLLFF